MAPRIFIFSIVLGAEYLSYLKSIETQTRAFLTLIILSIGTVLLQASLKLDLKSSGLEMDFSGLNIVPFIFNQQRYLFSD